ncbi:MAG: O-antigen ligase C-terminal domain-containing protein [Burkholderiales bacterium]|nr:O-antigen ligase C-terminal domain-containing protein [Burkholderiales bacterium]
MIKNDIRFVIALVFALTAPVVVVSNMGPSATLLNQLVAIAGWGWVVSEACINRPDRPLSAGRHGHALTPLLVVLAIIFLQALLGPLRGLPQSLSWQVMCFAGMAGLTAVTAFSQTSEPSYGVVGRADCSGAFSSAMLVAGLAGALIACLQVFAPEWFEGTVIARSKLPGRAVGNMRQPNHLSSILLWGLIALVPVAQSGRWFRWRTHGAWWLGFGCLMVLGAVLTASRTGALVILLLALWGGVDKRLRRPVRLGLIAAPLVYVLCWAFVAGWASETAHTFGAEARLSERDLSASRFGIWRDALTLVRANPWGGVGWGEFNFAWTLSPFPDRPVALFDNAHNLPLQLAVELGLPLAILICCLLVWTLWQAATRSWRAQGEGGVAARASLAMVLVLVIHSMLEYPLWYAYFLLPTAWALGIALRGGALATGQNRQAIKPVRSIRLAGVVMVLGSLFAFYDYTKVTAIYVSEKGGASLAQRIERGMSSVFFNHHVAYAVVVESAAPSTVMDLFALPAHTVLDPRLMMAWARALDDAGQRDRARYLAERLREFRSKDSKTFFSACDEAESDSETRPFQCEPPQQAHNWREFMFVR